MSGTPIDLFALIDGVAQHYLLEPRRFPLGEVLESLVARDTPPEGQTSTGLGAN